MNKSRIKNTVYNFVTSIGGQFLTIFLQFLVRTIFVKSLGKEYLGINGLFSNVLQMLSLAELGVGSAILFKLYDPLAKNDKKRIAILLKFYKYVYRIIGVVIIVIGLSIMPFLRFIVSDYDSLKQLNINAFLIYLLFLAKTVVSYFFFAYKKAIVSADQNDYKLNINMYLVSFVSSIFQIIVLILFKSFILYVVVSIVAVLLQNYLNALVASKLYPYIDTCYDEKLDKKEIKNIFKDCSALLLYRINSVVLTATDNIIISMFLGLSTVALYSNYYILYNTIDSLFGKMFDSVLHSLGNLHTTNNIKKEYTIFKTINFIAVLLGTTAGIGIALVSNEFINSWIGANWIIVQPFSMLMGIEIFGLAIRQFLSKYRSAMGLFQQAKYRPVFGMIINLIVSLLLVNYLGICGVLIGTIVADWLTIMWYDPYIIYKYGLKNKFSVSNYYLKNFIYIILAIISGFCCYILCNNIFINLGWISVIIHSFSILFIIPFIFVVFFIRSDEVYEIIIIIKKIIRKK